MCLPPRAHPRVSLPFAFFILSAVLNFVLTFHTMFGSLSRKAYVNFYWANEIIEQGFALVLMLVVVQLAVAGEKSLAILGQVVASVVVVLASALLTEGEQSYSSRWMTGFTRNLSFGVALMNFQVWGLLIAKRVRSREILLLACGLGLLTTGKSLGHTIRIIATPGGWVEWLGNYTVVATSLLATYTWWAAFRPSKRRPEIAGPKLVKPA